MLSIAGLPRPLRLLIGVRLVYGTALLISPDAVLGDLSHEQINRPVRVFARVLGARHLIEAAALASHPSRRAMLAGATVDGVHALTMIALARVRPDRRSLALANTASATLLSIAGFCEARRV